MTPTQTSRTKLQEEIPQNYQQLFFEIKFHPLNLWDPIETMILPKTHQQQNIQWPTFAPRLVPNHCEVAEPTKSRNKIRQRLREQLRQCNGVDIGDRCIFTHFFRASVRLLIGCLMLVPPDEVIFHPWRINEVQIMKGPGMIFRISKKGWYCWWLKSG